MKLFMSANSPYARKVRVLLREMGKASEVEEVSVNPRDSETGFWEVNPVAKIPTLLLDAGRAVGESDLIGHYLVGAFPEGEALAVTGIDRLSVLSLANGILDTGMVARVEKTRPGGADTETFMAKHLNAVTRALDALEKAPARNSEQPDLADIAVVCAVDWIKFRHPEVAALEGRPALAAMVDALSQRDSFKSTQPG
jgi:glutathione S-transferase